MLIDGGRLRQDGIAQPKAVRSRPLDRDRVGRHNQDYDIAGVQIRKRRLEGLKLLATLITLTEGTNASTTACPRAAASD